MYMMYIKFLVMQLRSNLLALVVVLVVMSMMPGRGRGGGGGDCGA